MPPWGDGYQDLLDHRAQRPFLRRRFDGSHPAAQLPFRGEPQGRRTQPTGLVGTVETHAHIRGVPLRTVIGAPPLAETCDGASGPRYKHRSRSN